MLEKLAKILDRWVAARRAQAPAVALGGTLVGKLLATAEQRGLNWRAVVVGNLPTNKEEASRTWGLTARDAAALAFSEAHAAAPLTQMTARAQQEIGQAITAAQAAGQSAPEIAVTLRDAFGALNRDWRRMALTETATAVANGYLAQIEPGEWVVGDAAVDCCSWCREHLQGRVYRMLPAAPAVPTAEESRHCVWIGKTNVGRSRYPVTQAGSKRPAPALWHPCIPAHPHCRCRWRRFDPGLDMIEPGTNLVRSQPAVDVWSKQ